MFIFFTLYSKIDLRWHQYLNTPGPQLKSKCQGYRKFFLGVTMPVVIIVGTFGYPFMEFPTEQVVKLDNQFDDNCFHNSTILLQIKREFLCHLTLV